MRDSVIFKIENDIAVLRLCNPPVNALGASVRKALIEAAKAISGADVKAVVLFGYGRCFSAGADISEFGIEPPAGTPTLPETIAAIEDLKVPVVAALHGFAFGGALELAVGAHYRIAAAGTKLGLPEVDIGIIPGAGGTQRLPRLIGMKAAVDMVANGTRIDAARGHDLGLIDEVSETDSFEAAAIAYAMHLVAEGAGPRPTSKREDRLESASEAMALLDEIRTSIAKKAKGRVAPLRALDALAAATGGDFAAGMATERAIFLELRDGTEARAMRHLFKAERAAQKIDDAPTEPPAEIHKAGVVGFGTMGQGIALVLARAGVQVTAVEIDPARLEAGLASLKKGLQDRVDRGRMSPQQMQAELDLINGTTAMSDLAEADLVIEAALENMDVKTDIFRSLDGICKPGAILATNTSSLDLDTIAAATTRPDNVAGAHFFAPAQVMKLLEIVRGSATSGATAAALMALAKRIGKVGVVVGNAFGFVGNRMYHRYTWQAYFLLQEGALPSDVDAAMQDFGFPLGCLAVGDISGLDVAWQVRKAQRAAGDLDPDAPYPVVADRICEKGWFGRKTGRGWYSYADGKPAADAEVAALIEAVSAELGIERRAISADEIRERCLFALINEGARLLGTGIAVRPGDIDVVWRYGYGFPVWRGGPMFMADEIGMQDVLATLQRLEAAYGPAFTPAPLIAARAAAGKTTLVD